MTREEQNWLINHVVESAKGNPRMARGLRDLIVNSLAGFPPGSEPHSDLLEILNNLDSYIAAKGDGYAKERVMP